MIFGIQRSYEKVATDHIYEHRRIATPIFTVRLKTNYWIRMESYVNFFGYHGPAGLRWFKNSNRKPCFNDKKIAILDKAKEIPVGEFLR